MQSQNMSVNAAGYLKRAFQVWRRLQPQSGIPNFRLLSTSESIVNKKLDGKVAIITGAAGAIGSTTARLFAAHGAQVIVADIRDGHKVTSEIGSNAHFKQCDVTKEEDIASIVDFAVDKFGKLDIMYNNAGIVGSVNQTLQDLDMEEYDRMTAVMMRAVVMGIKHAARVMVPAKQGVILTTSSTMGEATCEAFPLMYSICKSSLPGITKIASYRLGKHGIRVNVISPHGIASPIAVKCYESMGRNVTIEYVRKVFADQSTITGKCCTEDDIAKGALFLCSDDSGYVNGQNLVVDGGWCNTKEFIFF